MGNLKKGDNKVQAKGTFDLSKSGLNSENCEVVFETGSNFKSWKPGRQLNTLKKIKRGNIYLIRVKQDVEVSKL